MKPSTTSPLRPARIVALALIALAVAGLAYLRFAPGAARVSLPAGAHAGDLTLKPCSYSTERGRYRADCGTLVVPENRHDGRSRLIALPVVRVRARSSRPRAPIFRLEGGPGLTNMKFADASRFADDHDVVLVGYRGVDGSVRLDCPEVESALERSSDLLAPRSLAAVSSAYRACATRLRADGVDLAGYSLPERVDDLDAARRALGYPRVDLLSESAGTRTAMIYAWRYPARVARSVMVGVNPPGNYVWSATTTDEQIRKYAALCAKDESCRGRTGDLAATIRATAANVPDRWWFLPIREGNVRLASFFGLIDATSAAAPISGPQTIDSLLAAAKGDASGLWLQSVLARLVFPTAQVWGDAAAIGRTDASAYRRSGAGSILGNPGSDFLWAGGRLRNSWPATPDEDEYDRVRVSRVPTLLVGGSLDVATPPQNATRELLPYLRNGRQVVLPGLGHTGDFWSYQPRASARLVNAFLATGKVDTSLYRPHRVDFSPGFFTQPALAKIVLGSLLGLAALGILSLLALGLRVRGRGGVGRRASVSIRSAVAPILGLGGWCGGALLVLTALPSVPLDSEVLAGLSVGLPVGLAVFGGWVRRDAAATARATGLASALAGALVGAWLGFGSTSGLLGVLTAVAGATAGANLAVLAHDVAGDRRGREPAGQAAGRLAATAGA